MGPLKLTLTTALVGTTSALLVAPDSPCSQYCGNVLSSTTASDIICDDGSFSGNSAGTVFETCIDCELTSTYSNNNESDLQWLVYNLRYALSYCLAGEPNNTDFQVSPCTTSTACYPLDSAFYWDNLTTQDGTYDFCDGWIETQVPKCTSCLEDGTTKYLMNYITVLDAACSQLPAVGSTLSVQGTPFSTVRMNVTTPSQTSTYTYTPSHSAISLGGKVGIAIGGLVFVLVLAGFGIVCIGRRRRRAYLKSLEGRYGHTVWPSPNAGHSGNDMFETPTSQKPLRGWDNSPMTASSDNGLFPRYFSPYSSQYNSPVSAVDAKHQAWPAVASIPDIFSPSGSDLMFNSYTGAEMDPGIGSSNSVNQHYAPTQEQIERAAHERELAQIGLAAGGSSPEMHRLNSNMNVGVAHEASYLSKSSQPIAGFNQAATMRVFAKETEGNDESYELREIDSNGIPVAGPSAPVPALRHPGYGRSGQSPTSSSSSTPYGGLTEADAKTGKAV